jgi:hypothetical protein
MVQILSAALLLVAATAFATPAIPSFEFSVAHIESSVAALRAAQVKAKAGNIGPQIINLAWDLQRYERDTARLRNDLRWLQQRLRRQGFAQPGLPLPGRPGRPGRPDSDPSLRWDVQRFTRDVDQLTRDSQWRIQDLRMLTAQAEKDETLVAPATRLLDAARQLKSETNWFLSDARFAHFDFSLAGYTSEGWELDRNSRDLDKHAQDLSSESDRLLSKVRP